MKYSENPEESNCTGFNSEGLLDECKEVLLRDLSVCVEAAAKCLLEE